MLADAVVVLAGAWTLWDRHRHADEAVDEETSNDRGSGLGKPVFERRSRLGGVGLGS
jgi:hypothetical protein